MNRFNEKDKNFDSKGNKTKDRDDKGWSCGTKDNFGTGTCSNNNDGRKFDFTCNDGKCEIVTDKIGNKNIVGSYGNSGSDKWGGFTSNDKEYSGYGGNNGGSQFKDTSSQYGLHNLKELPRIANENEFAATCHGSIAVNSIIDHAITRNSLGHGANALASLKSINLSHNNLSDSHVGILNNGLYGYTLNAQTFNLSYNNVGAVGLDYLVKGDIGIKYLKSGGKDINQTMQGIFTLSTTSIVHLNLCNNIIGDIGAEILCHALVNSKLPATKTINVSGNNITQTGEGYFVKALHSPTTQDMIILTQKVDKFNKMIIGVKEEKIAIFKDLLKQGAERGVDTKVIVVDTTWLGKIKNTFKQMDVVWEGGFGFAKCKWNPEDIVSSYAQGELIAKLPKNVGKLVTKTFDKYGTVSCYVGATEDMWTGNVGQHVLKHELCVMGELEFCHDY